MEAQATKEDLLELILELIQNGTLESFSGEPIDGRVRATNFILQIVRAQIAEDAIFKYQQDNPNAKWARTFQEAMQDAIASVDFASAIPDTLVANADRIGVNLHPSNVTV
jgi:methionyl-tRNA formyltransferase